MATKFSTGLSNGMLTSASFKDLLGDCELRVYAGTEPATADASTGGATILCVYTNNAGAGGLSFAASAVNRTLSKDPAQTWSGEVGATGAPAFYRLVHRADDDGINASAIRVQGTCGMGGADLNLANAVFTEGNTEVINNYFVTLPSL